ncbi:MAG: exodeoxyribonuclease VII small subunit [Lentimicrobiaceae bacterium]|jgi:exodeoxyribonuclease VII small subunit|nr:exodeoxyribonuclease VII small subunit [Lentimicrobiaceae bacterium]MDG1901811.1 exodeoxyribonuclease VII small subunit [Bacteroidales bacterium]MDG2081135.1 exodeoxyribonuclease VII small subunit [Bacteroidales bacterium]|tara:strand:+ start:7498 stop:7692 length:195 start_codon:yes stop_codon:yes gene_type:complete
MDKIKYTDAIIELEELVAGIENNETDVDELTKKVKRASELIKICKEKLHFTEEEVNKILKDINA